MHLSKWKWAFASAFLLLVFPCGRVFAQGSLPSGWSDGDIGSVGVTGSASYTSNVFTVKGSGAGMTGTADGMNLVYQTLSGDGTIVARVVSSSAGQAGVMIRETLNANAADAFVIDQSSYNYFYDRTSTGATAGQWGSSYHVLPYWMKLVRSGNTFSAYGSLDGVNWTQIGSTQTVAMAQNVYIGLTVSSQSNSSLATATFDSVSLNSAASPAPVISGISPAAGVAGSQAVISGSGFGASQGTGAVMLNGSAIAATSWSGTSITVTIPTGATSGPVVVSVAPSMNDSNAFLLFVGTQPIGSWLDLDIGSVGLAGSATYANGAFTVKGSGTGVIGTADSMNFLFQTLSGDGTIVARVVSSSAGQAGVMIRETLNANAADAFVIDQSSYNYFYDRTSTGATAGQWGSSYHVLPYWMKLVRSGNTFSAYGSLDGVNWTQIGSTQTVAMAQNVYIGLTVSSQSNSSLATATFDSVSLNSAASPAPVISGISPAAGVAGSQAVISGSGFGASQGTGAVMLNGSAIAATSWSGTSITVTIPTGATSGPVVVSVAPSMNDSNAFLLLVATQPLPSWLDVDLGTVGQTGSASFSNGTFTVKGSLLSG